MQALSDNCTWLDYVYPIAEIGVRTEGKNKHKYPRLFVNKTKPVYLDLSPENDRFERNSFAFFELENSETINFNLSDGLINLKLNLIVWAKMDNISSSESDITDYLISQVKTALSLSPLYNDLSALSVEKEKGKVFSKYNYTFEQLRNIAYPYTCFKFKMDIRTIDFSDCVPNDCFTII